MTRKQRQQLLLNQAAAAQTLYWKALFELERAVALNLDDVGDLQGLTIDQLLESFGLKAVR